MEIVPFFGAWHKHPVFSWCIIKPALSLIGIKALDRLAAAQQGRAE
jgi:hypothetical protein